MRSTLKKDLSDRVGRGDPFVMDMVHGGRDLGKLADGDDA